MGDRRIGDAVVDPAKAGGDVAHEGLDRGGVGGVELVDMELIGMGGDERGEGR